MLSFDLRSSGFKSRINRHLLTVGSFIADFLYSLTFVYFFVFCNSMPRSGYSALHGILIKKIKKRERTVVDWTGFQSDPAGHVIYLSNKSFTKDIKT